jgi:catechol-2,3-dioxygenase
MKIVELSLQTDCITEMKTLYCNRLGFRLISEMDDSFSFQAGLTTVTFERARETERTFYHFAFNIPENRLACAKGWLIERGIDLIKSNGEDEFYSKSWNAHTIYFLDPAGNIVEFIARHNLSNSTDAPFGIDQVLNVSEIGLPVGDVREFSREISDRLKIEPYQPYHKESDTFCALGDEEGLLIVAKENRIWFPTADMGAECHPVRVRLEGTADEEIRRDLYVIQMRKEVVSEPIVEA